MGNHLTGLPGFAPVIQKEVIYSYSPVACSFFVPVFLYLNMLAIHQILQIHLCLSLCLLWKTLKTKPQLSLRLLKKQPQGVPVVG
jgi:hypothetical protein